VLLLNINEHFGYLRNEEETTTLIQTFETIFLNQILTIRSHKKDIISRCRSFTTLFVFWVIKILKKVI